MGQGFSGSGEDRMGPAVKPSLWSGYVCWEYERFCLDAETDSLASLMGKALLMQQVAEGLFPG